jgi:hypothetical protein
MGVEPTTPTLQGSVAPNGMQARIEEVRPGLNPILRPYHGRVLPQHLQTIVFSDPGWNRTKPSPGCHPGVFATGPRDHVSVTEAGVEPADSQDLGLFALPVCVPGHREVAGPGVAPGNPGL